MDMPIDFVLIGRYFSFLYPVPFFTCRIIQVASLAILSSFTLSLFCGFLLLYEACGRTSIELFVAPQVFLFLYIIPTSPGVSLVKDVLVHTLRSLVQMSHVLHG